MKVSLMRRHCTCVYRDEGGAWSVRLDPEVLLLKSLNHPEFMGLSLEASANLEGNGV
jgi:hypothetical protein